MYAQDSNDVLPMIKYRDANPTQYTYEIARLDGTPAISEGPYNLGLLWSTKAISDPQIFYCPSGRKPAKHHLWTHSHFSVVAARLLGANPKEDIVRTGYHYFPQSKNVAEHGSGAAITNRHGLVPPMLQYCAHEAKHNLIREKV